MNFLSRLGACVGVATLLIASACSSGGGRTLSKSERAQRLVDIAIGALNEGDSTGALIHLAQAEQLDDDIPELHHAKALGYFAKQEMERAIESARRALELRPDFPEGNSTYGKLLLDAGRYDEAVKPLLAAAENLLYRDAYKAQTSLGILYYRKGDAARSAKHLERAITLEPKMACIAFYYRGHLKMRDSKLKEAVEDYAAATKHFCAGFGDAHFALGVAYARSRKYDLARKKFLEIQQRYPDSKIAQQAMEHLRYLP